MIWRSKLWTAVAAIFTVVNIAGAVIAATQGEAIHAGVHALLSLAGAYLVWQLAPRRSDVGAEREVERRPDAPASSTPPELTNRLTHLEQAVDAVAIEVERIGEGQRFITRSFVEKGPAPTRGASSEEPSDGEASVASKTEPRD
ncbi:MAG TPA: hypothetical protein VFK04_11630 [Gemmatimonadaceae bacterium]|jgi:hypothetical protein|nr:hypothetical protein [Gemmatimonadaceae bacterium]